MKNYPVIFEIELNLQNYCNKFDISEFSIFKEENEILLFPNFVFQVESIYSAKRKVLITDKEGKIIKT